MDNQESDMDRTILEGGIGIVDADYVVKSFWNDPDCLHMALAMPQDADMSSTSNGRLRRSSSFATLHAEAGDQRADDFSQCSTASTGLPMVRNSSEDGSETLRRGERGVVAEQTERQSAALPAAFTRGVSLSMQPATAVQSVVEAQIMAMLQQQQLQLQQQLAAATGGSSVHQWAPTACGQEISSATSAPQSPGNSADDGNESSAELVIRRKHAKREYSKAYRQQQKSQVAAMEEQLNTAKAALQFLQRTHEQLQVEHAKLISRKAADTADSGNQELEAAVEQLRAELQLQKDLSAARESMVRKLLALFGMTDPAQTIEEAVAAALAAPMPAPRGEAKSKSCVDISMRSTDSVKSGSGCSGSVASTKFGRQTRSWVRVAVS
jgi:hypothetical protein